MRWGALGPFTVVGAQSDVLRGVFSAEICLPTQDVVRARTRITR